MRKDIIFLGILLFRLFILNELYSQSEKINIETESANFDFGENQNDILEINPTVGSSVRSTFL